MYRISTHLTSLRPSLMEARGVVVWQRGTGDGTSEGNRPAEAWAVPAVIDKAPSIYNKQQDKSSFLL